MTADAIIRLKAADIAMSLMHLSNARYDNVGEAIGYFLTILADLETALVNGVEFEQADNNNEPAKPH